MTTRSFPADMSIIPKVAKSKSAWYSPAGTLSRSIQMAEIRIVTADTSRKTNEKPTRRLSCEIMPFQPDSDTPELHIEPNTKPEMTNPTRDNVAVAFLCSGKIVSYSMTTMPVKATINSGNMIGTSTPGG